MNPYIPFWVEVETKFIWVGWPNFLNLTHFCLGGWLGLFCTLQKVMLDMVVTQIYFKQLALVLLVGYNLLAYKNYYFILLVLCRSTCHQVKSEIITFGNLPFILDSFPFPFQTKLNPPYFCPSPGTKKYLASEISQILYWDHLPH